MKTIRILKVRDPFISNPRGQVNAAAQKMSERTGFSIEPTESGFNLSGEWRGKFESEDAFAYRIVRDLELASGVMFESVVEG